MSASRRVGSATSETRTQILDATERLLVEKGYAAVTSRSVATAVGINAGLVHYYFPGLDDLFIAVLRRSADRNLDRMAAALASRTPLSSLWDLSLDPGGAVLSAELMAVANHRPALFAEASQIAQRARRVQIDVLRELLPQYGMDLSVYPPAMVATTIQGTAAQVARERELGIATEHEAAATAVGFLLSILEGRRSRNLRPDESASNTEPPKRTQSGGTANGPRRSQRRSRRPEKDTP